MTQLPNAWVKYFSRSYETIKTDIFLAMRTQTPEITDFSDSSFTTRFVQIFAGIADMIGYYIDKMAIEVFLPTLRNLRNAVRIANAYDYRIKGAFPAEATIRFFFSNPTIPSSVTIPAGTQVQTVSGVVFETLVDAVVPAAPSSPQVFVQAVQREKVIHPPLTSNGTSKQKFELVNNIVDGSIDVSVGLLNYLGQETFAFSSANSLHFVGGINENGVMEIRFGDGNNGAIPPTNATIAVQYYVTQGSQGNVSELSINQIVSSISVPTGFVLRCENPKPASGGADQEDIESIKRNVPLFVRTLERAVTLSDFKYVTELATGVAKAGVVHQCGEPVQIYIAPEGGGIAPPSLINHTVAWLDVRKTINVDVNVSTVGEVYLRYVINISALPNFANALVRQAVIDALLRFHSVDNQEVNGSVVLSDVYEAIESVSGVRNLTIVSIDIEPYARQKAGSPKILNWTAIVNVGSTVNVKWRIVFTSASAFNIFRNNVANGSGVVNTTVNRTEVSFSISGTYATGDEFEFTTYPHLSKFSQGLQLDEPSIIQTTTSRLTINVTGGL
jgi:hypothetical protein